MRRIERDQDQRRTADRAAQARSVGDLKHLEGETVRVLADGKPAETTPGRGARQAARQGGAEPVRRPGLGGRP